MDKNNKNCYNKDHSNIEAIYYCIECKIYICNKCENFHSKLLPNHHKITLDKNIPELFTGFCKEENHLDKLEYYCITHNKLCCSACIVKLKRKDKGQHSDCEICLIEDIKEKKENTLKENLINLEKLSQDMDKLIKEIKNVFDKINKDKEELKLNIQKIFTKIRNSINDREDEILLKVDELFDNIYMKESEMNEIDKYPKKIKSLIKEGQGTINQWKDSDKNENEIGLSSIINNCINIENNLININNMDKSLKRCKNEMNSNIKFNPTEEDDIDKFISFINKFGKIYKENNNKIINKDNNKIEQKSDERNYFSVDIKSATKEPKNFMVELNNFNKEEYNNYFPNNIDYKDNEIVFSFHLYAKNKCIEEIYKNKDYFEAFVKGFSPFNLLIRKRENKLILDFKIINEHKDTLSFIKIYEYFCYKNKISMGFKSDLIFDKIEEIELEGFYTLLTSFVLSFNISLDNIDNSFKSLQQKKDDKKNKKYINLVEFLMLNKKTKLNMDISKDKIINLLKESNSFENSKKSFNEYKELLKSFITNYIYQGFFQKFNLAKNLNFDKILIVLLFGKFKSGLALQINSKGINDYLKGIIPE